VFGKKTEKEQTVSAAQIEKAMGTVLRDMSDLTKQKLAENIVGSIRGKRIRSEVSEADLRAIVNIAEMSVDQALTSIGARVGKSAKDLTEK
jgi:hypothetical protein